MEHTKEPWRVSDKSKRVVCYGHDEVVINSEANASRIVACINACAGLDTEQLESSGGIAATAKYLSVQIASVNRQRDELLAVLEGLLDEVAGCMCTYEMPARAVIQKVRGG